MDAKTEKIIDDAIQRQEQFKNELANVIRLSDNIQSAAKDFLNGKTIKIKCRSEILEYANEIIKRVGY